MKTKLFFTMALVAIIAIICIVAIGCKDEPDDPPPPIETPIAYITDSAGTNIPIYKTSGVSDADAATAANKIKTAFSDIGLNPYRDTLYSGIKKIYILAGSSDDLYSFDKTTGILNMGSDWDHVNYVNCLVYAVYPELQ